MRGLAFSVQTAIVAATVGILFAPAVAYATPTDLSSVVVSATLPGFMASAPGPKNGPVNSSNLDLFGGDSAAYKALARDLADGDASGEFRFWVHQPPDGDGIVISAFQFKSAQQVGAFLGALDSGYQHVSGGRFAVPAVTGASGYTAQVSASGNSSKAYIVTFGKGGIAFEVQVITAAGGLNSADAVSVATQQAANTPGAPQAPTAVVSTNAPSSHRTEEIVGLALLFVLVAGLILFVAPRPRRRRDARIPSFSPPVYVIPAMRSPAPRSPVPPREVGWHTDPEHLSEQGYWDGESWIARRRWSGTAWAEVPIDTSS